MREAIYRTENVGLVVIDGIRDMVYDINSSSESTKVISLLMTWTGERNIHIHTILHQNKGDEHARGHIGTELSNKAETVLQVEKDSKNPETYGVGKWWGGDGAFWDFTKPEGRTAWKKYLTESIIAVGTDSVWNDNCEYDSLMDKDCTWRF